MQKFRFYSSAIFLASILLCAVLSVNAQTKIGSITISDTVAKRYFMDCYKHPDTIKAKTMEDYEPIHWNADHTFGHGDPISTEQHERNKQSLADYNNSLSRIAIATIPGYYIIPRKPSEQDFIKWYAVSK